MLSIENVSEWLNFHSENIIGKGTYGTVFSLDDNTAAKLVPLTWRNDLHSVLREITVGKIGDFEDLNSNWCKTQKFHILGKDWSIDDRFHSAKSHGMFAVTEMKKHETSVAKMLRANRVGFDEELAAKFLIEVCGQTSTIMMSGITPWDIKPDNVLFDAEKCSFHACDFGISSVILGMPRPEMCGTIWFRPIESVIAEMNEGWGAVKSEVNMEFIEAGIVWQIGMTALNMLLGRNCMAPLKGETVVNDSRRQETISSFFERLTLRCDPPHTRVTSLKELIALDENPGISLEKSMKLMDITKEFDHSSKLIIIIKKMLRLNPIFRPSLRVVLEELTWVGGINWHESVVFEPTCSFGFGSKVLNLPSPTDGFSREETTQVVRLVSLLVEMVTDRKKEFPFGSIAAASAVTASVVRALGNTAIAPCCEGCAHNLVVLVIEIATMLIFDYVDFVIDPVLSKKRECVCDHEISFSHKLTTVIAETCKMPDCFAHPFFKMRVQAADGRWELAKQITVCDDEIVCVMAELAKINNTLYLFAPKMTKISIENAHEWINDHHENIIGRGVYGTVFSLNDDTAAKLIDLEDKLDFCFLLREIAAGNITTFGSEWCKTHEFHIFDDGAVLEMKKHDMSLENKKIKGVLVQKFIVEICEQALTMLVSGMASLDIKPNNVLFDKKNESFHMCDFGINNTVLGVAQPKLCGALWFRTVESIAAEINGNKWTRPNVELIEAGIVWQIGVTALTLLLGVNPMSIRSKGAVVKKDKFGNETFVSFLERLSVFCDEPFMPMSAMLNYETLPENVGILISEINKNVKNPVNVSGKMGAMITKMLRLNPLHRPSLREIVEEMAGDGDHTVVVHRPSSRVLGSKVLNLPPPPKASPQAKLLTLMLCDSVKKFKHLLPFGAIAVTSTVLTQLVHDFQIENLNECCAQKLCGKTLEIVEMLLCDLNYFYDTKGCFMCKCAFKIPQDAVIRLACKLPDCFSHTFFKQKVMKARGEWGIVNTLGVQENEICCVRNEVNNTIYLFFKICSTMFFPCFT